MEISWWGQKSTLGVITEIYSQCDYRNLLSQLSAITSVTIRVPAVDQWECRLPRYRWNYSRFPWKVSKWLTGEIECSFLFFRICRIGRVSFSRLGLSVATLGGAHARSCPPVRVRVPPSEDRGCYRLSVAVEPAEQAAGSHLSSCIQFHSPCTGGSAGLIRWLTWSQDGRGGDIPPVVQGARPDLLQEWKREGPGVLRAGGGLLHRDGLAVHQRVHLGLEGASRPLPGRPALQVSAAKANMCWHVMTRQSFPQ